MTLEYEGDCRRHVLEDMSSVEAKALLDIIEETGIIIEDLNDGVRHIIGHYWYDPSKDELYIYMATPEWDPEFQEFNVIDRHEEDDTGE